MNNVVFGKTMKNVRKYKYNKLVTREGRRSYLVSEPIYYITNVFIENLLAIEMKKASCIKEAFLQILIKYLKSNRNWLKSCIYLFIC